MLWGRGSHQDSRQAKVCMGQAHRYTCGRNSMAPDSEAKDLSSDTGCEK